MRLRKWTYELIVIVALLCVGGGFWWYTSTKDSRQAQTEYEQLVRLANRQAVEIAIIEQSSKLADYRQQMAKAQQAQKTLPNPPMSAIADPVDVNSE